MKHRNNGLLRQLLIGADGKVIWGGNPLDLSVPEMRRLIGGALRNVDLGNLHRGSGRFLSRDPTGKAVSTASAGEPAVEEESVRYTLGWDFAICTDDNSMELQGVIPGSPAERAGLRKGDVVVAIDELVLEEVAFEDLKRKLHHLDESSDPVTLKIKWGQELRQVVVTPERNR